MNTFSSLIKNLHRIHGKGYKAYKNIRGEYDFPHMLLFIDHIQGDPFASPSKIRVRVPQEVAQVPAELFNTRVRRIAICDFLARETQAAIHKIARGVRGTGKSGNVYVDAGAQEVLERTAVVINQDWVEVRLEVGLPAAGRRILGRQAETLLCEQMPQIAKSSLQWKNLSSQKACQFVECVENQAEIRHQLKKEGLIAFVADGAILPRKSGVSDEPMSAGLAIAFHSPQSLRITLKVPNVIPETGERQVSGLGIPEGITLIVGGGYHGKSTLLKALERGVYPHIPGDGREYVVTNPGAVKIRAEDGRFVEKVDISPFISNLPFGGSTQVFSSDDASGSTSQAANIIEALEMEAEVLLADEDTSATNFMIRDARMQKLVAKAQEPITPFVERIRELYKRLGVSTVLVMGGSGDYLDVADTVIKMGEYIPYDVTEESKAVSRQLPNKRQVETLSSIDGITHRIPLSRSFDPSRGKKSVKIDAKSLDAIQFGKVVIELRYIEQLVDRSQTRAIGNAIHLAVQQFMDGTATLKEVVNSFEEYFDRRGLDSLDPLHRKGQHPGNFARPRKFEIAAAINRLRTLQMRQNR